MLRFVGGSPIARHVGLQLIKTLHEQCLQNCLMSPKATKTQVFCNFAKLYSKTLKQPKLLCYWSKFENKFKKRSKRISSWKFEILSYATKFDLLRVYEHYRNNYKTSGSFVYLIEVLIYLV